MRLKIFKGLGAGLKEYAVYHQCTHCVLRQKCFAGRASTTHHDWKREVVTVGNCQLNNFQDFLSYQFSLHNISFSFVVIYKWSKISA